MGRSRAVSFASNVGRYWGVSQASNIGRYGRFSEASDIGRDRDVYKDSPIDRYIAVCIVSSIGRKKSELTGVNKAINIGWYSWISQTSNKGMNTVVSQTINIGFSQASKKIKYKYSNVAGKESSKNPVI
jgi:hypothetical protein